MRQQNPAKRARVATPAEETVPMDADGVVSASSLAGYETDSAEHATHCFVGGCSVIGDLHGINHNDKSDEFSADGKLSL